MATKKLWVVSVILEKNRANRQTLANIIATSECEDEAAARDWAVGEAQRRHPKMEVIMVTSMQHRPEEE